jgi:selenocysteine lyase/cysteine desulfurase
VLDIDFVRQQFPAFSEPSLQGVAHFENAGGSYAARQVIDRLERFYRSRKVQPYYPHPVSAAGGWEMDEARERLSAYLGVAPDELHFGPSTTQNSYVLARAFGEYLSPGDAIVVTNQDHEANSGPWRRLAAAGITIREWQVDPQTGHLDTADLTGLLDERVRLVCFPHSSNLVAEVNPVSDIVALARSVNAWTCVDGVSFAPHGLPDVGELGADIYLFSSYKTFGPHQGIMTLRRELAEALPNQGHYFNADCLYKRFTPAGPDHAQVAACAGMVDYFEALYRHHLDGNAEGAELGREVNQLIAGYERSLLQALLDFVAAQPGMRLLGPGEAGLRAPTVSVVCSEPADAVARRLAEADIIAGCGNFYATRLMEAMDLNPAAGAVRFSLAHYTSREDLSQLLAALAAAG